ncbi:hypothetical protein MKW94_010114 [Papaver nudicaule]|uniref:Late embryogenesis abundant protein LEA-2 subgroup domain-containing protein n=1 Tax=Papaver nudicaule TaxID=74823 RepID=A0AA41VYI6_PAPNU|nr:hypothetical protein [Papaver nudicaule]
MANSNNNKHQRTAPTNLASCIVATIFIVSMSMVILIVFFTLFRPKDPKISINAVQLPTFSMSNNTVNFTFSQYVSVNNPNRAVFTHFVSSLQLVYSGNQVGFMFIPAGTIQSGRTQSMSAMFSVQSFPLVSSSPMKKLNGFSGDVDHGGGLPSGLHGFEMESKMKMVGRVKILKFFTHHVETEASCRVVVSADDGSVLGFHC